MPFDPTFPEDAPSPKFYDYDGTSEVLPEGGQNDPKEDVAEDPLLWVAPPPLPSLPVIIGAWPTPDPKVILVSISSSTVWSKSFYELGTGKLGAVWSIEPKVPIWTTTSVAKLDPASGADGVGSGPRTLEVTCANELSPGATYTVTIDSPTDTYDRPWKSSASFVTRGKESVVLVGGESSGKILPAVLRAFGAIVESTVGRPRTRTLGSVDHVSTEVRVETTAHFPASGDVFIGGVRFAYTSRSAGADAYLYGLSTVDMVTSPFPANTEVLLHVASIFPD